jgi:hypothetical protein
MSQNQARSMEEGILLRTLCLSAIALGWGGKSRRATAVLFADLAAETADEFVFRFNRRKSASRGKLFFRLAQQAVQVAPAPYATLITPQHVGKRK